MRRLAIAVAAALAAGASAGAAESPQPPRSPAYVTPSWSPGGLQIAYSHSVDAEAGFGWGLWAMNADGTNRRGLAGPTGTGDFDSFSGEPAWSPDGRAIAYTFVLKPGEETPAEILLYHLDGSPVRFLTDGVRATWSPDGTRVAFSYGGDIWVVGRDGNGRRALTTTIPPLEDEPSWSPAGWLAYSRRDRTQPPAVWAMNADGTGQTLLVADASSPAAGPEGRLAFVRARRIFVREFTGTRALTPRWLEALSPEWSRDGTKIAFSGDVRGCAQPGIWVVGGDGRDLRLVAGRDCRIAGTGRADVLRGTAFRDVIDGRGGDDRIAAGNGHDEITGGRGRDRILAGPGNDEVQARDGERDTIACGTNPKEWSTRERDVVVADRLDAVAKDCERVTR